MLGDFNFYEGRLIFVGAKDFSVNLSLEIVLDIEYTIQTKNYMNTSSS